MPSAVSKCRLAVVNRQQVSAWVGALLVVACGGRATTPDDEDTTNITGVDADGDDTAETGDSASGGGDGAGTGGDLGVHDVDPNLVVGSCGYANWCECVSSSPCVEYLQPMTEEQSQAFCSPPPISAGAGGTWDDLTADDWSSGPCPRSEVIARCVWLEKNSVKYYYKGHLGSLETAARECAGEFFVE